MSLKRKPKAAFIGLDIETTGLDPDSGKILEIGLVALNERFEPLEAKQWLVMNADMYQSLQKHVDPEALKLHQTSGLHKELMANTIDADSIWLQIIEMEHFLKEWSQGAKLPLVGSSLTFDRGFLRESFMWHRLLAWVHYRSVDATSVAIAYQAYHPQDHEEISDRKNRIRNRMLQELPSFTPRVPHRPIFDIITSAALIKACHGDQI